MLLLLMLVVVVGAVQSSAKTDIKPPYDCHPFYYTIPECVDHPDGYGCECGPGFHWNTYMCMSSAIDSRFEYKAQTPARYTLLLGKAFPKLDDFTIAFWMNVSDPLHPGTILSYKHGDTENLLRMMSGPTLQFEIWGQREDTEIILDPHVWYHIMWTWTSSNGRWTLFLNGESRHRGVMDKVLRPVPLGGEFVLGQSSRPKDKVLFNVTYGLDGDLAHLNIWDYTMEEPELKQIIASCKFMYCGNAVEWVEFRSGTRGAMKMRWPSGVLTGECFTEKIAAETCDNFCSDLIGAQCNRETVENIEWTRTKAEKNISIVCPGQEAAEKKNLTVDYATRACRLQENDNNGIWDIPHIDDCISEDLMDLKREFNEFTTSGINEMSVLELAFKLLNHTEDHTYLNPIDIASVIDLIEILVKTQGVTPRTITWREGGSTYARTDEIYPTFDQTQTFCQILASVVDNLLNSKNEKGWNATQPSGVEGDNLMKVMHDFADVISRSLVFHVIDGIKTYREAFIRVFKSNIEFKIETHWIEKFNGILFPDSYDFKSDTLKFEDGSVRIQGDAFLTQNASQLPVFIGISAFRYPTLARVLPGQAVKSRRKDDWVNTPIVALFTHMGDLSLSQNLTSPIIIDLPFLDTFNISNPDCVRLNHRNRTRKWTWTRSNCEVLEYRPQSVMCACSVPGVFAVTTDMFNENWDKGDKRPELMNFASYIGCTVSATLCLLSVLIHVYVKTSSTTASLHKNLCLSVMFAQMVFMFGIDRYDQPVVCQVFAILLHYFFLATYSWLMNEAFNLYIVITYSAHNQGELTDSGSLVRYYVLGWVIPAVLVGAFVGSHSDNYYAPDMCWIAWEHFWLFIGPAVGVLAINILVLIFTAKEHNENSYTKSEKTNKVILIHMKGVWTQLILNTVCWSFAFISIKMVDTILKYLFAMFNFLQGAFFVVFFVLLHEEVRAVLKNRQKKKALTTQGFEYNDDHSLDSLASCSVLDKEACVEAVPLDPKPVRRRELIQRKQKSHIEASSDEGSDCEMITSV
ncbi:cadherin EGF LAG seven-pass G-type receptor 1-like [Haliotis rubra]|uniref:cadherin EGF LAG seven-pass G-type receptor 1-like n=1 Tax=Haliotis rubra TaxID=36100 RepID=UPI001EE60908|nr:cadherin EGF LAG seven-pass G-type receptor 1-like [Haliotis rubra]